MTREPFLVIINKHHFSYIFKTHYVSDSLPGSKEIMFPATLKAKNLKAARGSGGREEGERKGQNMVKC